MIRKSVTLFVILLAAMTSTLAQDDLYQTELRNVCDQNNVVVFGEKQPKPKEGIHKIEHILNRDLKFLVQNPDFKGVVFIECTVNCKGQTSNYNPIVSCDNYQLESELIELLQEIDQWNVGTVDGQAHDYWYLWKFKVKKGKLTIMNKRRYYK